MFLYGREEELECKSLTQKKKDLSKEKGWKKRGELSGKKGGHSNTQREQGVMEKKRKNGALGRRQAQTLAANEIGVSILKEGLSSGEVSKKELQEVREERREST